MTKNANIDVHHVTRVEGHGNIAVNIKDGKIEKCEWKIVEAPRFFEAMVRGRHYTEVARITSRICGICSVGHTIASVKATEEALGMEVSEQTVLMRRILKLAETFDSNILHVLFLAAPDLLGVPSVFPLVESNPEVVGIALRLKRLGHEWGSVFAGRTTHPTKVVPGGFASIPTEKELRKLKQKILDRIPDVEEAYKVLVSVADKFPDFTRETEFIALVDNAEYGLYDGEVGCLTPDGRIRMYEVKNYKAVTNEYVNHLSTAKYTKHAMDSYMVGALARINLNYDMLHPKAKEVAEELGFKPVSHNPFMNNVAQFIECIHCAYKSIEYIDELLEKGINTEEPLAKPTKFGRGSSSAEVPRGILFHEYEYDKDGFCTYGNCVIPTNQNHGNIQLDMEKMIPEMMEANKTEKEMEHALEMLVRAYDPCISCSTHYLDVKWKK